MQDPERLRVYASAKQLALRAYAVAASLPPTERFELARQLRRAAVSVGSNIAEGSGRSTSRDFASFLAIALGSVRELKFQFELAEEAGLSSRALTQPARAAALSTETMLVQLIRKVRPAAG